MLQAQWMQTAYDESLDEEGKRIDESLKLHHTRSIPYLEECIAWNQDGNFDRVSAMGMLMILREDRFKRIKSAKANQNKTIKNIKDDNFFDRNYKKAINS